jgi:hypothetical protein
MFPRPRLVPFGLFFASALLFAFSLLNMSIRSSSAQIDPTAQQETANAIVAQMFAATQTAQAGDATPTDTPFVGSVTQEITTFTPTPTATPTPIALPVSYPVPIIISLSDFDSVPDMVAFINEMVTSLSQSLSISFSFATTTPTQWEYMLVGLCTDLTTGNYRYHYEINTRGLVSRRLFQAVQDEIPLTSPPINILQVAGEDGWELMPITDLYSYFPDGNLSNGFSRGSIECSVRLTFRRPVIAPPLTSPAD